MKRYLLTVAAVFVVATGLSYLVMGVILAEDLLALGPVIRSPEERKFPVIFLSNLISALAFGWIFSRGVEANKPWVGQGLRFGLAVWFLRTLPVFLINYAIMPMPGSLIAKQSVYTLPLVLALGVTTTYMYRTRSGTPTE